MKSIITALLFLFLLSVVSSRSHCDPPRYDRQRPEPQHCLAALASYRAHFVDGYIYYPDQFFNEKSCYTCQVEIRSENGPIKVPIEEAQRALTRFLQSCPYTTGSFRVRSYDGIGGIRLAVDYGSGRPC